MSENKNLNDDIAEGTCEPDEDTSEGVWKCQFILPNDEPYDPIIGAMYYDEDKDVIKVMTKTGWKYIELKNE